MKCPYQTRVIHKPQDISGYYISYAKDITEFCECVKSECPFYYTFNNVEPHCRKVESEYKK